MSALSNTVRWTRRSGCELRNKSTALVDSASEAFKLPALNALHRSIKHGDLSFATSRDLRKLRQEPEQPEDIEQLAAHHSLMAVRQKYDNMGKARAALQQQVDDLQKKRDALAAQRHRFEEDREQGGRRVQELEEGLRGAKGLAEEAESERKVVAAMGERLRFDKVVYDLRRFNLEKELRYLQRQREIILRENASRLEEEDKTRRIHQQLLDHLQAEQAERQAHLDSLSAMVQERVALGENSQLRRSEMQEIAERTLQDKDVREKNWRKVWLCGRFVERLLRDKMSREMLKFSTVEVAFKNIKTATGVHNTQELVRKFLNKERAYGELLGKIAENERHIAELKTEHEDLVRERRTLETEQDELNANRVGSQDLQREQKAMHMMAEKSARCSLLLERVAAWAAKNSRKFDSLEDRQPTDQPANAVAQMKAYLQRLSKAIDEVSPVEEKPEDASTAIGGSNFRVELGREQRAEEPAKNQYEEDDFVNSQRNEILRNNDKFMRELRKKQEELKKARIEAEPKRREAPVERPKPQPVDA